MNIILSAGQADALAMIDRFMEDDSWTLAIITGYAGTGKTTLIRLIAEEFGTPIVLTPTGKAAIRVTEATGLGAMTIHRFLYKAETDPKTGSPVFTMKPFYELAMFKDQLVLIDEASMVSQEVWNDLATAKELAGFKILLMGDTFQLPPVSRKEGMDAFSALNMETPHRVHLTEVVRQALDSPIIRASMLLREGKPEFMAFELLEHLPGDDVVGQIIDVRKRGGVAIVHTNKRRHNLNVQVRTRLGYPANTLEPGEPLLVTQNTYPIDRYNGEIVNFDGWDVVPGPTTSTIVADRYTVTSMEIAYGVGIVEGNVVTLALQEISGQTNDKIGNGFLKKFARYVYLDERLGDEIVPPHLHANYGYALTCHKSQGSEWPEALVILEDSLYGMPRLEYRRWLYTAITRAKSRVLYTHAKEKL